MRVRSLILAAGAAFALTGAVSAQETIDFFALNGNAAVDSGGNVGTGTGSTRLLAGRPTFNYTFANSFLWSGSVTINGMLRTTGNGTFASEARIRANSPLNGASTGVDIQPFTSGSFAGTITATNVLRSPAGFTGVPFNPQGQNWEFSFYESFNDGGSASDAFWDSLSITFNAFSPPTPPACIDLGNISNGNYPAVQTGAIAVGQTTWFCFNLAAGTSPLDILTFDSLGTGGVGGSLDAELGLYNSNGFLLATNDDVGDGVNGFNNFSSRIRVGGGSGTDVNGEAPGGTNGGASLASLAAGTYYLALSTFNSVFSNAFTVTGGNNSGAYRLTIIPTPGAAAILGLGILAAGRRRRA